MGTYQQDYLHSNGSFTLPIISTQSSWPPKYPDKVRPTAGSGFNTTSSRPLLDHTRLCMTLPPTRQPLRSLLDHANPYTIPTWLLDQYSNSTWPDRPGPTGVVKEVMNCLCTVNRKCRWSQLLAPNPSLLRGWGEGDDVPLSSSTNAEAGWAFLPLSGILAVVISVLCSVRESQTCMLRSCRGVWSISKRERIECGRVVVELIWTTGLTGITLIGKRSGISRVEVEVVEFWKIIQTKLDLYTIVSRSTWLLLVQYLIASRALGFSILTRFFVLTCQTFSGRKSE